jgi:hypothetical protein
VALRLLNGYPDLFIEASQKSSKLSVLVELAKVPHSFPSGCRFGLREQLTYDCKFFSCFLIFIFIFIFMHDTFSLQQYKLLDHITKIKKFN